MQQLHSSVVSQQWNYLRIQHFVLIASCSLVPIYRALTPLLGNGAGAHGIGKISGVLTEIGRFDITLMYDVFIARLIPILKLTLVYYEKREGKKQVLL